MTGAIYVAVKTALRVLTLVYTFVSSNCYILTKLFFSARMATKSNGLIQFAFNMAKVT